MALVVNNITPANAALQISVTPTITIEFNNNIDSLTVNAASVVLVQVGTVIIDFNFDDTGIGSRIMETLIDGALVVSTNTITFTPDVPLQTGSDYKILVGTNFDDVNGDSLNVINASSFTTTNNVEFIDNVNNSVNLLDSNANVSDGRFTVLKVRPSINKILANIEGDTEFVFTFSEDVLSTGIADQITLEYEALLDDTEEEIDSPGVVVAGPVVTITPNFITSIPDGMALSITFDATLEAVSGKKLFEELEYIFVQRRSSFYVPVKLFKLKAGQLVTSIKDITLVALISNFSNEIDTIVGTMGNVPGSIKQAWVYAKTLYHLLCTTRTAPADMIAKELADFRIEVKTKTQADLFNRCVQELRALITALDMYFATRRQAGLFIKSFNTVDYPHDIGRLAIDYYEPSYRGKDLEGGSNRAKHIKGYEHGIREIR